LLRWNTASPRAKAVAGGPLCHWQMDIRINDPFELSGTFMKKMFSNG
jgi:hypothetical protein